jgi:hypothetical protein
VERFSDILEDDRCRQKSVLRESQRGVSEWNECSTQTKRSPVVCFNGTHKQATTQDIVETPRETYKGLICDSSSLRIKLGELEPPQPKDLE